MQVWRIGVLCALLLGADALNVNRIDAPVNVVKGDTVTFKCDYDLQGGKLKDVKWFHNNLEFYRYRELDGGWAFPEKDMIVDLATSDEKQVTLSNISQSLGGAYRCSVTQSLPDVVTLTATHQLTVSKSIPIKNLQLVLPQGVTVRDPTVTLECRYELDGVHLDSVKWYKDSADFYTFQPGHPPLKESKPLPGIHVDVPASNGNKVVLNNIDIDTAGNYRCQVTTDTQPPQSLSAVGNLSIANPRIPEPPALVVFVPSDVHEGDRSATLHCNYDLKGEKLYAVKWYKDDLELYRYTTGRSPQQQTFRIRGINVDESTSDDKQLTLTDISKDMAGLYYCEVLTDEPYFYTLQARPVQFNVQEHTESRTMYNPKLIVPENVHDGDKSITIQCDYDLHGERLYAVRWFKNSIEFYRFLPSNSSPKQVYYIPGVNVNLAASDDKHLVLSDVSKETAGLYQCEVNTDSPLFLKLEAKAELNVLDAVNKPSEPMPAPERGNFFNRAYGWLRNRWNDIKPK